MLPAPPPALPLLSPENTSAILNVPPLALPAPPPPPPPFSSPPLLAFPAPPPPPAPFVVPALPPWILPTRNTLPISVVFLAPAVPLGPGLFRLLDELEATAGPVGAADDGCEILGDIGGTGSG